MSFHHRDFEPADPREFWWIASDRQEDWAGVRIAVFIPVDGLPAHGVIILGEYGSRMGVRFWDHIVESEGWRKVKRIEKPTAEEIAGISRQGKESGDGPAQRR